MSETKINWWKIAVIAIAILLALFGGFFWGKNSVKTEPQEPIYIKGDTVKVEVECPYPVKEVIPCDTIDIIKECVANGKYAEFFPERIKEVIVNGPVSEDTLLIVKDWATERLYEEKIYDTDTIGSAIIKAKTQYNRLSLIGAEINPVIKEVPVIMEPKIVSPFVSAGITTCPTVVVQGGVFIKDDWGGSIMYQYDWKIKNHIFGMTFMYKF